MMPGARDRKAITMALKFYFGGLAISIVVGAAAILLLYWIMVH